jgi:hypothetical protein
MYRENSTNTPEAINVLVFCLLKKCLQDPHLQGKSGDSRGMGVKQNYIHLSTIFNKEFKSPAFIYTYEEECKNGRQGK